MSDLEALRDAATAALDALSNRALKLYRDWPTGSRMHAEIAVMDETATLRAFIEPSDFAHAAGALVPRVEAQGEVASRCPACGEEMYPLTIAEMKQEHMREVATLTAERAERDAAFVALWKAALEHAQGGRRFPPRTQYRALLAAIEAARPFIEEAL